MTSEPLAHATMLRDTSGFQWHMPKTCDKASVRGKKSLFTYLNVRLLCKAGYWKKYTLRGIRHFNLNRGIFAEAHQPP